MGPTVDELDDYISVREAAALLRVSQSTMWRWVKAGDVRSFRLGPRRVRVRRSDLPGLLRPARSEEPPPSQTATNVGELTESERVQMLEALEALRDFRKRLLEARNGVLFPSSTEEIREMRAERDAALG